MSLWSSNLTWLLNYPSTFYALPQKTKIKNSSDILKRGQMKPKCTGQAGRAETGSQSQNCRIDALKEAWVNSRAWELQAPLAKKEDDTFSWKTGHSQEAFSHSTAISLLCKIYIGVLSYPKWPPCVHTSYVRALFYNKYYICQWNSSTCLEHLTLRSHHQWKDPHLQIYPGTRKGESHGAHQGAKYKYTETSTQILAISSQETGDCKERCPVHWALPAIL